jgi:transglutaminase-like putative cysteine protease
MSCDVSLRVLGFARTLRAARRLAGDLAGTVDDRLVQRTLHNIVVATALYPGRSKCLEQAVAAFVLLRRRQIPVQLRLGVQPYPFSAHAWVELNGVPLSESPEVVAQFALMPDAAL